MLTSPPFPGSGIHSLRHDARFLKLPPYVSALCILIGVAWLLLLPLDDYSRQTYISENALLPGQVHTYFGGSEHNVFRAYRHEVAALANEPGNQVASTIGEIFKSQGLKVARQKYRYSSAGGTIEGENVYAVLRGPRADATEAIVLVAAWRNMDGVLNQSGVALVITLARYFKRWSLWSKDIIFVITEDSTAGPQAWVDAYHDAHSSDSVQQLSIKGGALQGAVVVDYPAGPAGHRFDKLHLIYDGVNGQLPNLDLFNTIVNVASMQVGITCIIQRMWNHADTYNDRLQTMLRGMVSQGLGHASGPHSSFIPYHVDAITLQTVGDGTHDEMSLGRVVEGTVRSLNNLLEHLHQSFFFYLLMQGDRFVSIGTYLPSAMLIAVNFTITAIALWMQSSRPPTATTAVSASDTASKLEKKPLLDQEMSTSTTAIDSAEAPLSERPLTVPLTFTALAHALGLALLNLSNSVPLRSTIPFFLASSLLILGLPHLTAHVLSRMLPGRQGTSSGIPPQEASLITSASTLLLGMSLSTLSTLNFSLGCLLGLLAAPLSFVRPTRRRALSLAQSLLLTLVSPPAVLVLASAYSLAVGSSGRVTPDALAERVETVLTQARFGWSVSGVWTQVVVWLVWWPAWVAGAVVGSPFLVLRREEAAASRTAATE